MQHLQSGTLLQGGKYKIEKMLGQGGFGITYLAIQSGLERKVAVKEFFMKELCGRDENTSLVSVGTEGSRETVERFREKFLKEARNLARLKHPNIVSVIDVFEENGTAYYVMEFAECGSLADKVKREGYLTEPVATRYILQVADALRYVHQRKMNHLDVKPANIMLNENDEAVLIDFGLAKQYDSTGSQTSTTPVGISHGYAPMEQYMQGGVGTFSPETDVYALGATYYSLLTGMVPPNASYVSNEGLPLDELKAKGVSLTAITTISKAMKGLKKDRLRSIQAFIDSLKGVGDATEVPDSEEVKDSEKTIPLPTDETTAPAPVVNKPATPAHKPTPATKVSPQRYISKKKSQPKRRRWSKRKTTKLLLWCIIAGLVAVALLYFGLRGREDAPAVSNQNLDSPTISYQNNVLQIDDVSYKMISVEGGTFTMGATQEQVDDAFECEKPAHEVTLSSYYIGETEVTQALWKAVMGNNPSFFKGDNLPVEQVSWDNCQLFIEKLNSLTGKTFRLPTEAEWEFAARGGNKSNGYEYSGSNNIDEVAWYNGNSGDETHPVKTKAPNELGIYDMSGNVREWCQDWYGLYSSSSLTNPLGSSSGSYRVIRGGSWDNNAASCRTANRYYGTPSARGGDLGFRLALSE